MSKQKDWQWADYSVPIVVTAEQAEIILQVQEKERQAFKDALSMDLFPIGGVGQELP